MCFFTDPLFLCSLHIWSHSVCVKEGSLMYTLISRLRSFAGISTRHSNRFQDEGKKGRAYTCGKKVSKCSIKKLRLVQQRTFVSLQEPTQRPSLLCVYDGHVLRLGYLHQALSPMGTDALMGRLLRPSSFLAHDTRI